MPDDSRLAELFETARAAQARAYVPYSRFKVGAAILTPSGAIPRRLQRRERGLSAGVLRRGRRPSPQW